MLKNELNITITGWRMNGRQASKSQREKRSAMSKGVNNPTAKVNEAIVLSIRRLRAKGDSLKSIAERHNISVSQVSAIANNKFWKNDAIQTTD